jgi:2-hydroxychromene-2-carboxylate isomerase
VAAFYYDLASPDAWLAAERVVHVLGEVPEFVPVTLSGLAAGEVGPFRCAAEVDAYFEDVRRRAEAHELMGVRPPAGFPPDTTFAMLAATYAKQIGKVVAFSLAAFRQAYAGGRDLSEEDNVAIVGAACEIHPRALLTGAATRSAATGLARATALARERGVRSVPAVWVAGEVFHGDAELERAAAALGRS